MQNVLVAALSKIPGDTDRAAVVDDLTRRIRRRVADLKFEPAHRVAAAVVYGHLPEAELDGLLAWIDQHRRSGTLRGPAWWAFVGGARKLFARHGIAWPRSAAAHQEVPANHQPLSQ